MNKHSSKLLKMKNLMKIQSTWFKITDPNLI
jgi:hypothetical protein